MKRPLPNDFHLAEGELQTLKDELQKLEGANRRNKWVLALTLFTALWTVLWFIVVASSERAFGVWVVAAWLMIVLVGNLASAGFIVGFVDGKGLSDRISKPFLHTPTEKMLRYGRFRKEEAEYQNWYQKTQEDFWNCLSGAQFEREVLDLLNKSGFVAQLTSGSGDGGVDIILDDGTIIQCKARLRKCVARSRA